MLKVSLQRILSLPSLPFDCLDMLPATRGLYFVLIHAPDPQIIYIGKTRSEGGFNVRWSQHHRKPELTLLHRLGIPVDIAWLELRVIDEVLVSWERSLCRQFKPLLNGAATYCRTTLTTGENLAQGRGDAEQGRRRGRVQTETEPTPKFELMKSNNSIGVSTPWDLRSSGLPGEQEESKSILEPLKEYYQEQPVEEEAVSEDILDWQQKRLEEYKRQFEQIKQLRTEGVSRTAICQKVFNVASDGGNSMKKATKRYSELIELFAVEWIKELHEAGVGNPEIVTLIWSLKDSNERFYEMLLRVESVIKELTTEPIELSVEEVDPEEVDATSVDCLDYLDSDFSDELVSPADSPTEGSDCDDDWLV